MHRLHILLTLALVSLTVAGCDLIGDVLEFGFWAFVILILIIVVLVWLLRSTLRRGKDRTPPPPGT